MPYKDPAERRVKHAAYRRKRRKLGLEPKDKHKSKPEYKAKQKEYYKTLDRTELAAKAATWRMDNPAAYRAIQRRYLLKQYGLTIECYERMLAEQGGVCAICETEALSMAGGYLAVDHCHDTGKVRGLLCGFCNVLIGHAEDNIALLERMISYLRRHRPVSEDGGCDVSLERHLRLVAEDG